MEVPIGDSDTDNNVLVDMMEHRPKKDSGKHFGNDDVHKRTISGTCNVCTAPCSSCMHNERMESTMESKVEGAFQEKNVKKEADNCSSVNCGGEHVYKSRACDDGEHATSEGSNFSASSTHDLLSENAESDASIKIPETCNAPKCADMPNKAFPVEIVAEGRLQIKSNEPESINTQNLLSSASHTNLDSHPQPMSLQSEEKHELGCYGETISSFSKTKEANTTVDHLNSDLDMKSIQCNSVMTSGLLSMNSTALGLKTGIDATLRKSGESSNESLKPCSGSSSANGSLSQKPYQSDCSYKDTNSTIEFTHSLPHIKNSSSGGDDSVDILPDKGEKNPSPTKGESFPCITNYAHKIAKGFSDEDKNMAVDVSHANSEKLSHELVESDKMKEENGNSANEFGSSQPSMQPDQVSDNYNEPDALEDDVKVCDICGDAGQEEFLANCTRCTDGAEHTYCMRIMMTKLPEGDWLCDECMFKENAENKKVVPPEGAHGMSKEPSFNKSRQDVGSINPKDLFKLDDKPSTVTSIDPKDQSKLDNKMSTIMHTVKGLQNIQVARERPLDSVKASSASRKMLEIRSSSVVSLGTTTKSTVKKSLSHEGSFKSLDSVKVRPIRVNSINSPPVLGKAPTSLALNSSNIQSRFHSPRASFSKLSFDNLKQKAKIEDVPHKTKLLSEYTKVDGKKETVRIIDKAASFKGIGSSRLNIDMAVRNQHNNQMDDLRSPIQGKEKNILQRKNSFASDRPRVSSSPFTSVKDLTVHHDGKLSDLADTIIPVSNKGSEVAINETKQQTFRTEKSFPPNIVFTSEDQKQCRRDPSASATDKLCDTVLHSGLSQSLQQASRDFKKKSISLGNSRQTASAFGKILKCQKCNETGHATQSCSIDKIRLTALKPSGERNMGNKNNKWKDTVEAALSKAQIHNRLSDQPDRLPLPSNANLRMKISDKDKLDVSSHFRKPTLLEGTCNKHKTFGRFTCNIKKIAVHNEDEQKVVMPMEDTSASGNDGTVIHSDALKPDPPMQMLTKNASMNLSLPKVSAIPEIPHIWKGSFEVHRSGNFNIFCDGVQAHLSTSASPKVLEVAANFPCKFQLEEASCDNSWPSQFQRKSPTEDNIALFFFAADFDSHQNYTKLVDNMLKNDLVLKGSFDGFELLIFPSNKLHERSRCWNGFYFLWGVFRGKRTNYLDKMPDFQKKLCETGCDAVFTGPDFTSSVAINLSVCQKVNSFQRGVEESSTSDIQVKMGDSVSTEFMNFKKLSCGTEHRCFDLNENTYDDKSNDGPDLDNHMSSKRQRTCSLAESSTKKQTSNVVHLHSSMNDNTACSELMQHSQENQDVQTNVITTTLSENSRSPPKLFTTKSMESFPESAKASPTKLTISQGPDIEAAPIEPTVSQGSGVQRVKRHSIIDLEADLIDPPWENDKHGEVLSCDVGPSMKHTFPYLQEPISQASDETLSKECLLLDQREEQPKNKKLKLYHDLDHDCSNESPNHEISERNLFSISSCSFTNSKPGSGVPFPLVLLDEDASVSLSNIPNFEQALGSEKERESQKILPLFLSLADSAHAIPQDDVGVMDKDDDASTSLSLSLAFPPPESENSNSNSNSNSSKETKQLLPEVPNLNSPLLLFGGVIDSGRKH